MDLHIIFFGLDENYSDFDWMKIADSPMGDHTPKTTLEDFKVRFVKLINKIKDGMKATTVLSL